MPGQVVILNKYIYGKHIAHALCLFYVYNNLFDIVKVSIKLFPAHFSEKNHAISITLSSDKKRWRSNFEARVPDPESPIQGDSEGGVCFKI